ncbi:MAG: TIGR02444 family protein [Rubrivivax sp.]
MTARAEHPFWRFSLALWAQPPVVRACLALQDRHGADVNLVLLCCWMASRQQRLDRRTLARAMRLVGAWQADVVRPLRAARRALARALPAIEPARAPDLRPPPRLRRRSTSRARR